LLRACHLHACRAERPTRADCQATGFGLIAAIIQTFQNRRNLYYAIFVPHIVDFLGIVVYFSGALFQGSFSPAVLLGSQNLIDSNAPELLVRTPSGSTSYYPSL